MKLVEAELEKFTASSAVSAGLIDAIQRGETKIAGRYEISKEAGLSFKQQAFTFTDRRGESRFGKFSTPAELQLFWRRFGAAI